MISEYRCEKCKKKSKSFKERDFNRGYRWCFFCHSLSLLLVDDWDRTSRSSLHAERKEANEKFQINPEEILK